MIPPRLLVSHKHMAPRELVQLRKYAESEARFWCVREQANGLESWPSWHTCVRFVERTLPSTIATCARSKRISCKNVFRENILYKSHMPHVEQKKHRTHIL